MGILVSPQDEIEQINLIDATATPRKVQSVVAVGNQIIIKVNERTVIIANRANKGKWAYPPTVRSFGFGWIPSALKGLQKLGIVSKAAVDAHIEYCQHRDREYSKKNDLDTLERLAKEYGKPVPKTLAKAMAPTVRKEE